MTENNGPSLIKPGLDTPFHIDYAWWQENDREWSVYLHGMLGEDLEQVLSDVAKDKEFDWVNPETGEIRQVAAIQYFLAIKFAEDNDEDQTTSMIEVIFREFLKYSNTPLTANELAKRLDRPAKTILKTLSGIRVYRGMRPYLENSI